MLPFFLWIIRFPTNRHPQSLGTEKSCCKNFSQVQTISQGKERDEKRKDVCCGREGWRKEWKVNGLQRVGTHGGDRAGTWSCAGLRGYANMGLWYDASLCPFFCHSFCSSLLFREAIGGAITPKADITAILSTPCPLHIRFVILQQGQGISSDRCLRVPRVLTRSNLSMGFYFTG